MIDIGTWTFAPVQMEKLFVFHRGKVGVRDPEGTTLYIAAAARNNGLVSFVNENPLFPAGWLSIVNNGDGGAGYCAFQPAPFWGSSDITALEPRFTNVSAAAKVLLARLVTHQCFPKYSFGHKPNNTRLARQPIMMPIIKDENGNEVIDWQGLDQLGSEMFGVINARVTSAMTTNATETPEPPVLNYEPMLITDVFESMKAARTWFDRSKAIEIGEPYAPYVARSGGGNGIGGFLAHQGFDTPNAGNAITIGVSTSTVFYQPVSFYTSKEIQVLRHTQLSEYNGLVLVSILRQQMSKFKWGNGASLERLKATRIMVPVANNADGNRIIDWDGMNQLGHLLTVQAEKGIRAARDGVIRPAS